MDKLADSPSAFADALAPHTVTQDGRTLFAPPLAVVVGLLQAASAIIGIIRGFKKDDYDKDVFGPLQAIINGINDIIRDIEALREFIPVALDDAFRKALTIKVGTIIDTFSIELAGLTDKDIPKLPLEGEEYRHIEEMAFSQMQNCLDLRGYGYPGYFALATAALSHIAMRSILRGPRRKAKIAQFESEVTKWLTSSIDPADTSSFATAAIGLKRAGDEQRSFVNSYPRDVYLGFYTVTSFNAARDIDRPDRPERTTTYINWYATLQGDFDSGLSWAPQKANADRENPRGWPLIPSEAGFGTHLQDRDQSAQARCENNLWGINRSGGGLNNRVAAGKARYARAAEVEVTITGIKELIEKIKVAAKQFQ